MRVSDITVHCSNRGCETKSYFKKHKSNKEITEWLKKNGWLVSEYSDHCCVVCQEFHQESCGHGEHPEWIHKMIEYGICVECGEIFEENFDAQREGK